MDAMDVMDGSSENRWWDPQLDQHDPVAALVALDACYPVGRYYERGAAEQSVFP